MNIKRRMLAWARKELKASERRSAGMRKLISELEQEIKKKRKP